MAVSTSSPTPEIIARYPLAAEQLGMWYVQQLSPRCGAYNLVLTFEARLLQSEGFDARALLRETMEKHSILRTCLPAGEAGAEQQVWSQVDPVVVLADAQGLSADVLRELVRQDARLPFDLSRPPLWRVHVYELGESRHLVTLVMHHALLDFWSLGLILQSVGGQLGLLEPSADPVEGSAYGAYALAQAERLAKPDALDAALAYWRKNLEGAPPVHGIPLDHPRPPVQTYDGRTLRFSLPSDVSQSVHQLARTAGATPFMTMLAAYVALIHRYSGEDDVVVASPVAGRVSRSQRSVLGQFVNTIALRQRIDPSLPFSSFVGQVRQTVVDALRHQDCPFTSVVEHVAPHRDPSYSPLAQLSFAWERLPLLRGLENFFLPVDGLPGLATKGMELRPFFAPQQEGQMDLTLEMGGEHEGCLVGVLKYNHQLFDEATVQGLLDSFIALVGHAVRRPETCVGDLNICPSERAGEWLAMGGGEAHPLPDDDLLLQIVRQATSTPDAVAVRDINEELSYRSLMDRAGLVASKLANHGVAQGERVGLMLDRTADLPAAILGIWAIGAAYVPLDPAQPVERLRDICEDAEIAALVSSSDLTDRWPVAVPTVCVDVPQEGIRPVAVERFATGECAYMIYTSGSTGKPKGVQVGHRSVKNLFMAMQEWLEFSASTRLLAVTTPAFDISVIELLMPLVHGGRVVVCDRPTTLDGVALARRLEEEEISVLQATPSTWQLLLYAGWSGRSSLTGICTGEPLPPSLAEALMPRTRGLWNLYGPTETTVWASGAMVNNPREIHLGRPLMNTQLYVLDDKQRPVPPGVMGELWVGGEALAMGYWRRPELTSSQFRCLSTLPEAGRLYRTGDRVRRTHKGILTHHGRLDFQVKLRGYRIELGEIEAVLCRQPGVDDAVVMVREDRAGDPGLVAYLIADPDSESRLLVSLREFLPSYMIPRQFVFLKDFPRTGSNKVNRKALPAPQQARRGQRSEPPRDELEVRLAAIFQEVLNVRDVGVHDDFFELGGHSLLAVRLTAAIGRAFQVELPVSVLVQYSTVAMLAQVIRSDSAPEQSVLVPLREVAGAQPLWLVHPIGGNVFCYRALTKVLDTSRPVLAFQAAGLLDDEGAEVSVEELARSYVRALLERQPSGPYLLGGWCFGGAVAYEMARQLRDRGDVVDGLVLIDSRAPVEANIPNDADDSTLLSWFARDLALPYGKRLDIRPETLRALSDDDKFEHVMAAAKAEGVLEPEARSEDLMRHFETYMANGIALRAYLPTPEGFPMLLIKAADEPEDFGVELGWDQLALGEYLRVDVKGDHNSILYPELVPAVAAIIDRRFPASNRLGRA